MTHNGFSIIEAVLALAIVLIAVSVFAGALLYGSDSLTSRHLRLQARLSASECLHVARWLRDSGGLEALPEGIHGLAVAGETWTVSGMSDINGPLTRQMSVEDIGEHEKDVTCSVRWNGQFGQRNVIMETRITEWTE